MSQIGKLVITGPPGAGKTTAISCVSDFEPVNTEMATTDELSAIKDQTTVAMDYGEISLDDGHRLRIYGTPGQQRFRHMWELLARDALGLIILLDATRKNPSEDLDIYLENFTSLIDETAAVVVINRSEQVPGHDFDQYQRRLQHHNRILPVLEADPRKKGDVLFVLDMLLAQLEFA